MELNLIGMAVADMTASLAFYRLLGLEVPADADGEGHVEITLPGGIRLAWDTVEVIHMFDPEWRRPRGGPAMGLAFRCDSPADVDTRYAEIVAAGYRSHREPWDAFWGQRYAQVLDPDGNVVDLFAELAG